jgi:hypothetical protein
MLSVTSNYHQLWVQWLQWAQANTDLSTLLVEPAEVTDVDLAVLFDTNLPELTNRRLSFDVSASYILIVECHFIHNVRRTLRIKYGNATNQLWSAIFYVSGITEKPVFLTMGKMIVDLRRQSRKIQ